MFWLLIVINGIMVLFMIRLIIAKSEELGDQRRRKILAGIFVLNILLLLLGVLKLY